MNIDDLKANLSTLTRPEAAEVVRGVRAMLEALPPATASAADAHQRAMLEAFTAGYELGTARPPKSEVAPYKRLQMFLQLEAEYMEAAAVIGDPDGGPGHVPVSAESAEGRALLWRRLLRVCLLRKFYAPDDTVQLPKVAAALRDCNPASAQVKGAAAEIDKAWAERNRGAIQHMMGALLPEGTAKEADPFEVLLYGRLIHADETKYDHLQSLGVYEQMLLAVAGTAQLDRAVNLAAAKIVECKVAGLV